MPSETRTDTYVFHYTMGVKTERLYGMHCSQSASLGFPVEEYTQVL